MAREYLDSIEMLDMDFGKILGREDLDKEINFLSGNSRLSVGLILPANFPQLRRNKIRIDPDEISVLVVLHHLSYPAADLIRECDPNVPMTDERDEKIGKLMKKLTALEINSVLSEPYREIHRFDKWDGKHLEYKFALQRCLEIHMKFTKPVIPDTDSGNWSLPKGAPKHMSISRYWDKGNRETIRETIVREVLEETNLKVGVDYKICEEMDPICFEFMDCGKSFRYAFYVGELINDNIPYGMYYDVNKTFGHSHPRNREIERVAFIPISQISNFLPKSYGRILEEKLLSTRSVLNKKVKRYEK